MKNHFVLEYEFSFRIDMLEQLSMHGLPVLMPVRLYRAILGLLVTWGQSTIRAIVIVLWYEGQSISL